MVSILLYVSFFRNHFILVCDLVFFRFASNSHGQFSSVTHPMWTNDIANSCLRQKDFENFTTIVSHLLLPFMPCFSLFLVLSFFFFFFFPAVHYVYWWVFLSWLLSFPWSAKQFSESSNKRRNACLPNNVMYSNNFLHVRKHALLCIEGKHRIDFFVHFCHRQPIVLNILHIEHDKNLNIIGMLRIICTVRNTEEHLRWQCLNR